MTGRIFAGGEGVSAGPGDGTRHAEEKGSGANPRLKIRPPLIPMKTLNGKNIHVLNDLIETCRDGQEGFDSAAKEVKDDELKRVFTHFAAQRSNYRGELQQRVRTLGGDADKHGSISGTLHRGWMDLKAALTTHEPHAVLAECERGEDAAVANYREALAQTDLDNETRNIVQRQAAGVREAHDRIKQLRDSVAYAHH